MVAVIREDLSSIENSLPSQDVNLVTRRDQTVDKPLGLAFVAILVATKYHGLGSLGIPFAATLVATKYYSLRYLSIAFVTILVATKSYSLV